MAHSLSSQKRIRQNLKNRARNRWRLDRVRNGIKALRLLIQTGKLDDAKAKFKELIKIMDQVAAKGTLHKNTVARYKSRLNVLLTKAAAKPA